MKPTKRRTDKERLDFLIYSGYSLARYQGVWWVAKTDAYGHSDTVVQGDAAYKKQPRQAIDAAMSKGGRK